MSKTYFITSDIHSCYTALISGLKKSGFDIDNPDHILISCGDIFDRGDESIEVYNFLKSLPKDRRILIRGNHEYLFLDLYQRQQALSHDLSNGTLKTMSHFMECSEYGAFFEILSVKKYQKVSEIVEWLKSDEWVNYYELGKYIFVHSFIPLNDDSGVPTYYTEGHNYSYKKDWRTNTSPDMWEEATWGCPFALFDKGLFEEESQNGKILVYGHWHTFRIREHYKDLNSNSTYDDYDEKKLDHSTFFGNGQIGLDGCTPYTGKVNILKIYEEDL